MWSSIGVDLFTHGVNTNNRPAQFSSLLSADTDHPDSSTPHSHEDRKRGGQRVGGIWIEGRMGGAWCLGLKGALHQIKTQSMWISLCPVKAPFQLKPFPWAPSSSPFPTSLDGTPTPSAYIQSNALRTLPLTHTHPALTSGAGLYCSVPHQAKQPQQTQLRITVQHSGD